MKIRAAIPIVLGTILGSGVLGVRAVMSADEASPATRRAVPSAVHAASAASPSLTTSVDAPRSACAPHSACAEALRANEASIDAQRKRLRSIMPSWRHYQELASLHLRHARLTGDYDSYGRAEDALARAFALAPEGTGPLLARAQLNFALHRFERVEADLQRLEAQRGAAKYKDTIDGIRADLAFYGGRYDEAARRFDALALRAPTMDGLVRLANYHAHTGDFDEADRMLARARETVSRRFEHTHAWLELQRGLLDLARGRDTDALAHYQTAAVFFDGWYLVDEHIAEVIARRGNIPGAIERYRDLVARTDNPEFMAALAGALEEAGRIEEAAEWHARAATAFEQLIERFPSAAGGHALEYFLEHGEPRRALELAEANAAARPWGEARVGLARALIRTGALARAESIVHETLETPYRSADLHATAAVLREARGDVQGAEAQRSLARRIAPGANEGLDWLRAE